MRQALAMLPLADEERQQLKAGLRSHKAFTLRHAKSCWQEPRGEPRPNRPDRRLHKDDREPCGQRLLLQGDRLHPRGVTSGRGFHRGRPRVEEKEPAIIDALEQLLADETAGDPMCEKKWVRVTQARLAQQLEEQGYRLTDKTVARLLKQMGFSLKANRRRQIKSRCPERDEQFVTSLARNKRSWPGACLSSASIRRRRN